MFLAASWVVSLDHNISYSKAASKMLDAYIAGMEAGREKAVLGEIKRMRDELDVTYEQRGNFKELSERAVQNLKKSNAESVSVGNPK